MRITATIRLIILENLTKDYRNSPGDHVLTWLSLFSKQNVIPVSLLSGWTLIETTPLLRCLNMRFFPGPLFLLWYGKKISF